MDNLGATLHKSLHELPQGGLSLLTRFMAAVSLVAGAIVVLYAILTIALGTVSAMAIPWTWSIGQPASGPQAAHTRFTTGAQVTSTVPVELSLDMQCPELKKTDGDIAKCAWRPQTSGPAEIAAARKARQTPGNWFNAAIRPFIWSLPVFLLALGLLEAARCLNGLAAARYFDAATLTHLRNFAVAGLLYVALTPCMPTLANLVCNAVTGIDTLIVRLWPPHAPYTVAMPTSFEASAVVSGFKGFSGFLIGLYAFTLAVIATVMARASAIVEDHAEII